MEFEARSIAHNKEEPGKEQTKLNKALKSAASDRDYAKIDAALRQGADADAFFYGLLYEQTTTVLYSAISHKDLMMADIVLAHKVNPNIGTETGKSALYMAVVQEHFPLVTKIIAAEGFDPSLPQNKEALLLAEKKQYDGVAEGQIFRFLSDAFGEMKKWKKIDNENIQSITYTPDYMLEITDIFNFSSGERTKIVRDYKMNTSNTSHDCFVDVVDDRMRTHIEKAWKKLQENNGGRGIEKPTFKSGRMRQIHR